MFMNRFNKLEMSYFASIARSIWMRRNRQFLKVLLTIQTRFIQMLFGWWMTSLNVT
jgi:hypothetical protein